MFVILTWTFYARAENDTTPQLASFHFRPLHVHCPFSSLFSATNLSYNTYNHAHTLIMVKQQLRRISFQVCTLSPKLRRYLPKISDCRTNEDIFHMFTSPLLHQRLLRQPLLQRASFNNYRRGTLPFTVIIFVSLFSFFHSFIPLPQNTCNVT